MADKLDYGIKISITGESRLSQYVSNGEIKRILADCSQKEGYCNHLAETYHGPILETIFEITDALNASKFNEERLKANLRYLEFILTDRGQELLSQPLK